MSRPLALDAIALRPTPRPAHTEYSLNYHLDYIAGRTGLDPESAGATRALDRQWMIDFKFCTDDGLRGNWGRFGRATDMGHASYAADGSDQHAPVVCPFSTADEVWAFDAVAEYGLPDFAEQVAAYERIAAENRRGSPDVLKPGGYYKTIVSGAIAAFGWEMTLVGCSDMRKMERVLDGFFRRTLFHMRAWAETSVDAVIQHDDFVWTEGAFMHPEHYRKIVIPRYAELWKPLRDAGKKVLFCSDGDYTEFAEDVAAAGADGLIFEPCMDFGGMVDKFGGTHCLVGSHVDCRDMTFGRWDVVRAAMDRTQARFADCRGLIWAVGNHLPANIPAAMMDRYIGYLHELWGGE